METPPESLLPSYLQLSCKAAFHVQHIEEHVLWDQIRSYWIHSLLINSLMRTPGHQSNPKANLWKVIITVMNV